MARTNSKTSTKYYDEMIVNEWALKFEYETENGVLLPKLTVQGAKGNSSVFISKANNQVQTIFSNGNHDSEVVSAVIAEFEAITTEFTPVEEA